MSKTITPDIYELLEGLIDLFDCMYFDGKKVDCFEVIKDIVDQKCSIKDFGPERRKDLLWQFQEAIKWMEGFHVFLDDKDIFLSYLKSESD